MNVLIFIAGLLTSFVAIGHFAAGIKMYLKPMLDSNMELIPKTTMQAVFHYVSVFLVLAAITLVLIGINKLSYTNNQLLVKFIGSNFILFTGVQIFYAFKNRVKKPLITMFQWTLFLPIGVLCLI